MRLDTQGSWGRSFVHNFLRFLTLFGDKIGVFLKCSQRCDNIFENLQ
jgi:hypothetical protein